MNKHKLLRLQASLKNRPHLISKDGFQAVDSYLSSRNIGLMDMPKEPMDDKEMKPSLDEESGIGVITIRGPLTYRSSGWEGICGGFSYEMLMDQVEDMCEAGIKTIVIDCDSGGGEAYGCFESAEECRKMCDDCGVKMYCYIDGSACSAMYAIACVCDEVIVNTYGEAGSIGVLVCLYNDSKAMEKEGIERTFVTDGSEKVPFADDGSWREGFLQDIQEKVAMLGDDFRNHVSKYTGLSVEDIKATNARVYSAQEALKLGLVNKVMPKSEFVNYIVSKQKEQANA